MATIEIYLPTENQRLTLRTRGVASVEGLPPKASAYEIFMPPGDISPIYKPLEIKNGRLAFKPSSMNYQPTDEEIAFLGAYGWRRLENGKWRLAGVSYETPTRTSYAALRSTYQALARARRYRERGVSVADKRYLRRLRHTLGGDLKKIMAFVFWVGDCQYPENERWITPRVQKAIDDLEIAVKYELQKILDLPEERMEEWKIARGKAVTFGEFAAWLAETGGTAPFGPWQRHLIWHPYLLYVIRIYDYLWESGEFTWHVSD